MSQSTEQFYFLLSNTHGCCRDIEVFAIYRTSDKSTVELASIAFSQSFGQFDFSMDDHVFLRNNGTEYDYPNEAIEITKEQADNLKMAVKSTYCELNSIGYDEEEVEKYLQYQATI